MSESERIEAIAALTLRLDATIAGYAREALGAKTMDSGVLAIALICLLVELTIQQKPAMRARFADAIVEAFRADWREAAEEHDALVLLGDPRGHA